MVRKKDKAKDKGSNKRLKEQRAKINAAKEFPEAIWLPQSRQNRYTLVGEPRQVHLINEPVKTNLIISDADTGELVLQRISPTSLDKKLAAEKSAKKGLKLYKKAQTTNKSNQNRGTMHLGFWNQQGNSQYQLTKDLIWNTNADKLLEWARDHSDLYLQTLHPLIQAPWHQHLDTRKASMDWLRAYMQEQVAFLPDWWACCTFFSDTTPQVHTDSQDQAPSFLFNFGAPTLLRLEPYKIDVQLDPLDIAIFNTSIKHKTHSPNPSATGRWAFSSFMRKVFYEMRAWCMLQATSPARGWSSKVVLPPSVSGMLKLNIDASVPLGLFHTCSSPFHVHDAVQVLPMSIRDVPSMPTST